MGVGEGASPHQLPTYSARFVLCVMFWLEKNSRHYHFTPIEFNANVAATLCSTWESWHVRMAQILLLITCRHVLLVRLGNVTVHVEVFGGPGQSQGYPICNKYITTANDSQLFSVGDPDVLGHPGSGSTNQRYGSGSFPYLIKVLSVLK
jgi:hypothetical protein